jgi:hypothetical protein
LIKYVLIAGIFSYPSGVAASSRLRNLAYGFHKNNVNVKIVSLYQGPGSLKTGSNVDHIDDIEIKYHSLLNFRRETSNLITRAFSRINFYFRLYSFVSFIFRNCNNSKDELIFIYGRSFLFLNFLFIYKKLFKIQSKIVFDIVEPPRTKETKLEYLFHPFVWDSSLIYKHNFLRNFDGCTFISYNLQKAFRDQVNKSVIVPSIRIGSSLQRRTLSLKTIKFGYLGALLDKDNPDLMFSFFKALDTSGLTYEIHIIGRFNYFSAGRDWIKKFQNECFNSKLFVYDDPPNNRVEEILKDLDFLVLFRRQEYLQLYTFPTRIVELISLQKVIVTNSFGDVDFYFKNGYNCVCINDSNFNSLSYIFNYYKNLEEYNFLLKNSHDLLMSEFNPIFNSRKILDMFR